MTRATQRPPNKSPTPSSNRYKLKTCIVSGDKLGEMGEPVVYEYEGRQIKFCCKACIKDFKKEPARYVKRSRKLKPKPRSRLARIGLLLGTEICAAEESIPQLSSRSVEAHFDGLGRAVEHLGDLSVAHAFVFRQDQWGAQFHCQDLHGAPDFFCAFACLQLFAGRSHNVTQGILQRGAELGLGVERDLRVTLVPAESVS